MEARGINYATIKDEELELDLVFRYEKIDFAFPR